MVYQKVQKIWIVVLCIGSGARQTQPQFCPWLCDCHNAKAAAAAFGLDCSYERWLSISSRCVLRSFVLMMKYQNKIAHAHSVFFCTVVLPAEQLFFSHVNSVQKKTVYIFIVCSKIGFWSSARDFSLSLSLFLFLLDYRKRGRWWHLSHFCFCFLVFWFLFFCYHV